VAQRTADLEQANQNLEAINYSTAHDLRTPLRASSSFSQALLAEYGDRLDETGRGYANRIVAASNRMAQLIDDLPHLHRASSTKMTLELVDLSAEVAAVADDLRQRDPARHVRVSIQDGVLATADPGLIRTVLENLLENAWKFTSRNDDAAIEFTASPAGEVPVCCRVHDNGVGFDPAYLNKLFQPFQRLHSGNDFAGSGIGLASVRRIVERHGGRTWAEGGVGRGATFFFTLDARAIPLAGVRREDHPAATRRP
jgi:light-regulated signal transduction histidine kinase (bacteriophytochrome)